MNYGIRISANGVDVKTGADKDMVVTSKYEMLKGTLTGSGTVSAPQDGSITTVTVAHGLGYIPMVQAYAKDRDGDYFNQYYFLMPAYDFSLGTEIIWKVRADATNIYLDFGYNDLGFGGANVDIQYTYYIFINKGKLT